MAKKIFLCAINNVLSGNCLEDCAFCTQSVYYGAKIARYKFKDESLVLQEAKRAKELGALGYCLVTAGKGLDSKKLEKIISYTKLIKKEIANFQIIACNGTASLEMLKELKKVGVTSYNHNLESSQNYYAKICSTHSWNERYECAQNVKKAGLKLCCGGIFGMGESQKDREEFIKALISLKPDSVPINFYIPNEALPIKKRNIEFDEALEMIKKIAKALPKAKIMVAGGREHLFDTIKKEKAMYEAGANAIVIGDYLTTKGVSALQDQERIKAFGYEIARDCDGK